MTHRFFVSPHWLTPPTVTLPDETARQIKTVLRMRPGDHIIVLDNSGFEWQVRLTKVEKSIVQGDLIDRRPVQTEPKLRLTLYQGTLKAQKFEWILQKGTELGVSRFVPIICERSVATKIDTFNKKQTRWQRIIQEAAEQSQRGKLPELVPVLPFDEAIQLAHTNHQLVVMPWEEARDLSLKTLLTGKRLESIALFIGPEGGFTDAEAATAATAGTQLVTLGPRILRAETAGVAVCSAILYELGEWE